MHSESVLASFEVSINGNFARAAYDSQLAESSILLSFCSINRIYYRFGICNSTVTVKTSTGEFFTCAINLRISDGFFQNHWHPYDVILGRDWFKFCSTALEDNPEAAVPVRLSSSNQWLIFAASPINAIHTTQMLPSSKFHLLNGC